jgi:hypothetical protein
MHLLTWVIGIKGLRVQKKTFDPRSSKVLNPFVQAYVEKQTQKAKPIGDRQKIVNILFSAVLAINIVVLGIVVWSSRTTIVPELTGTESQSETAMGEAMAKIKALEINIQYMRNSIEYHKNAYFKLEQEHETMKAALARAVTPDSGRESASNYPVPVQLNATTTQTTEAASVVPVTHLPVRENSVAAQLSTPAPGQ